MMSSSKEDLLANTQLLAADFAVIAVYFITVISVGLWSAHQSRKKSAETHDRVGGYFLASRNMHFIPVGASLFASNIGSEHFIGLAGSGAAGGIAIANYEINAIFILMLLGWLFVPVYLASGIYTMPEYLQTRFGGRRIQMMISCLALLAYIFTKISADLYAGALFIKVSLGLDGEGGLYSSIIILLLLAAMFTIFGGLSAVIWTDFIQAILMVSGALLLMAKALMEVGGLEAAFDRYSKAEADADYSAFDVDPETNETVSCGAIRPDFAHMFRSPLDGDLPWTGTFTGMFLNSIWYWCADQVIVQRTLASRSIAHAKGGTVLAAYLKILPLFMLVIPGMIARVIWPNEIGCTDPEKCSQFCGSSTGCTNMAYILLVLKLLPLGLRGLMIAVMLAALMSSLTSVFNSASTIFTMDLWKFFRPRAADVELVVVGRCAVVALVAISVWWIPVMVNFKNPQLFVYIQAVSSFIQPPITAVFLLALVWHRMTEPGAFWALMAGFLLGLIRFVMEFAWSEPPCGDLESVDMRPEIVKVFVGKVHFLHFGFIVCVLSSVVAILVSLATPAYKEQQLQRLTFWTRFSSEPRLPIESSSSESDVLVNGSASGGPSTLKKWAYKLCCVTMEEEAEDQTLRFEVREEERIRLANSLLKETATQKIWTRFGAVGVMCVGCFLWGYFA